MVIVIVVVVVHVAVDAGQVGRVDAPATAVAAVVLQSRLFRLFLLCTADAGRVLEGDDAFYLFA